MSVFDADPWPADVKRAWNFTMRYKGIDGRYTVRDFIGIEQERVNENLIFGLMTMMADKGGWIIPPRLVIQHFLFADMPPAGACVTAITRMTPATKKVP